jgi:phosphate starvation-inducible PhoH-like protein
MLNARNLAQRRYIDLLSSKVPIVIGSGPAGTGKTLLACNVGSKTLQRGGVSKLILTRPAVSVDEQHGFLPGTLEQKMSPWTRPMFDALSRYFRPKDIKTMMEDGKIEVCPLAYMRGRTFDDAWIIGDEMQNSTPSQMKMLLTRIGFNSKLVIAGDIMQYDRGFEHNGLADLISKLTDSENIQHIQFTEDDIQRHEVIKEVLRMYQS